MPSGTPQITVVLPTKPWWHSKTLWFNALCAALAAAEAGFAVLQPLLPVNAYATLLFGMAVGNAVLRAVTTMRLSLQAQAATPPATPPAGQP